ncbi:MAG: histidine kinase [Bacteroidales bacterium]|nr:histidine kinase [Bacteroidales bacterium]
MKNKYIIRIAQHLAFWALSYYILLNLFSLTGRIVKIDFIYTAVFHVSLIVGVYLNLLILIPLLLSKKKYVLFSILFIIDILFSTGLNIFILDKLMGVVFPGYYFISYYDFFDIMKFQVVYILFTSLLKLSKDWFSLMESRNKLMLLQKEKINTELKALKAQINPHFLFNSLNNIYSLSLKQSTLTPEIILKLSSIMRYMLYETTEQFVLLNKELNIISDYVELQRIRSDGKAKIELLIKGDASDYKIAPLLFIPFIENAFKHGIKASLGESFVKINIEISEDKISFLSENNKGEIDETEAGDYKGIGLENVKKRLELIYKDNYSLDVYDKYENFIVKLDLNLK